MEEVPAGARGAISVDSCSRSSAAWSEQGLGDKPYHRSGRVGHNFKPEVRDRGRRGPGEARPATRPEPLPPANTAGAKAATTVTVLATPHTPIAR
jgi:hypothetical protein